MRLVLVSFLLVFGCVSCSPTRNMKNQALITMYCDPVQRYYEDTTYSTLPVDVILKDAALLKSYSKRNLLLANAIGIYPELKKLDNLRSNGYKDEIENLQIRQKINFKVLHFSSQILSIAAELDCEGERAYQLSSYLFTREQNKVQLLTIASITVAAVSGVYTSLRNDNQAIVGAGGGAASAALGLMALFSERKVLFLHKRNLLTDIWTQPDSSGTYPDAVWYVLTNKHFSNEQETSIAHNIRARWVESKYIEKNDEKLYFGAEGRYSAEELKIRANMLNQLQASVRTIYQHLEALLRNISLHYSER